MFLLQGALQTFMEDRLDQQVMAIYALQVFCHNNGFPKGMLKVYRKIFPLPNKYIILEDCESHNFF